MATPPLPAERVAKAHYAQQVTLAKATSDAILSVWASLDLAAIARGWATLLHGPLAILTAAQREAAASADRYVGQVLDAQGIQADPAGLVNPGSLAGIASDGRPLASLLFEPAITTLQAIKQGATPTQAKMLGAVRLDTITRTQVADPGRAASGMAVAARIKVGGYVRMLNLPSCSRCVVLAGKWYRWNAGFLRHPRCDCIHVPVQEDTADEVLTEPRKYFDSLSTEEQDRVFTKTGAESIRLGADISQVVNARRGARGLDYAAGRLTAAEKTMLRGGRRRGHLERTRVFGRELFITSEGVTTRGVAGTRLGARETGTKKPGNRYRTAKAPRLMPESILEIAGEDREEAVRLLKRFGYLI